ncbi:MAG: hypothetical protein ACE37F_14890 [Nannocystaceae bacterium]|nr:hypothetical protein [bacterium]
MSFKAGGLGYPESFFVEQLDALKKRAAFDLDCDADSLKMTQLRPGSMASIGVAGCDAKATYLWTGSEWVMNNTSEGD